MRVAAVCLRFSGMVFYFAKLILNHSGTVYGGKLVQAHLPNLRDAALLRDALLTSIFSLNSNYIKSRFKT
jgi:hypothetical protein